MALAIVCGVVVGVVGFFPLILGLRLARRATPTSNLGHASALLLGVFLSLVVLFAAVIVCVLLARPYTVPFVLAEAIALCVFAVLYGCYKHFRK